MSYGSKTQPLFVLVQVSCHCKTMPSFYAVTTCRMLLFWIFLFYNYVQSQIIT